MNRTSFLAILIIVALITPTFSVSGGTGVLKRNREMERAFFDGRPPADFRYYATGRENVPDAIIGLKPPWRQTARFWREIDPETQDLNRLIRSVMRIRDRDPYAFDIVSSDGEVIGVYWSTIYFARVDTRPEYEARVFKPREPTWE